MRSFRIKRPNFSSDTKNRVPINGEQDRRHIVPYDVLRDAVLSWYKTHPGERKETAEQLITRLNNHVNNLDPGDRAFNRAIGSIGYNLNQKLQRSERPAENLQAVSKYMGSPYGFRPKIQEQILAPMIPVMEDLRKENENWGIALAKDIQANAEFDYPFGESKSKRTYDDWASIYQVFKSIINGPNSWNKEDFEGLINVFLKM